MITLAFDGHVRAQSVEEMYLDIKPELVGLPAGSSVQAKRKIIDKVDIKNGFMTLKGEAGTELAKFSRRDGGPLLAIAESSYADGRRLPKQLMFFEKQASGAWTDVTSRYLPDIPGLVIDAFSRQKCGAEVSNSAAGTYRYHLPRKGRIIRAVAESDALKAPCSKDLFHLQFDDLKVMDQTMTRLVLTLVP